MTEERKDADQHDTHPLTTQTTRALMVYDDKARFCDGTLMADCLHPACWGCYISSMIYTGSGAPYLAY